MKRLSFIFLCLVVASQVFSQVKDPVRWTFEAKKISDNTYEVSLTANLDAGWHIYSQTTPEGGPAPTVVSFSKNPLVKLEGAIKEEGKMEQRHEELFGVDVKQYSGKVVFIQTVTLKAKAKTALLGTIEFMTCNNRECLPPKTQKFSVSLK
jgi:hypothetical protein